MQSALSRWGDYWLAELGAPGEALMLWRQDIENALGGDLAVLDRDARDSNVMLLIILPYPEGCGGQPNGL